jgi:uncharacterized protein YggE
MRLVALGLALALGAALPAPAAAQVSVAPLAQGEVLVQTSTLGHIVSAPDRATLSVLVSAQGPNNEVARREAQARLSRVRAAVAAAGVAPADIAAGEVSIGFNYTAMPPELVMAVAGGLLGNEAGGGVTAMATLQITIRDLGRMAAVRAALEGSGVIMAPPAYSLADDSAARNAARAQAMQKARAEAESYAASLNMRVVRIVRITERIGLEGLNLILTDTQAFNRIFTRMWRPATDVDTMVAVGVDFALAPR